MSRNLIVSPDGKTAAATAGDGFGATLFLWDLTTSKAFAANEPERGHLHSPEALVISNGGRTVASASYKDVRLWDAATGRLLRRLPVTESFVGPLAFSNDDRHLFVGPGTGIEQFETDSGKSVRTFDFPESTRRRYNVEQWHFERWQASFGICLL